MDQQEVKAILNQVAAGSLSTEDALLKLKLAPLRNWILPPWTCTGACGRARQRSYTAPGKRRSRSISLRTACGKAGKKPC